LTNRSVTLRDIHDHLGSRHLAVSLSADGTLTIEGHDLGKGVEQTFGDGNREYEWAWTVRSEHIPHLVAALDAGDDVLAALATRFSNDAAAALKSFLDERAIPHECWSRIGS
jgi:hypothetical protein